MFNYHGYSGPCPKEPLKKEVSDADWEYVPRDFEWAFMKERLGKDFEWFRDHIVALANARLREKRANRRKAFGLVHRKEFCFAEWKSSADTHECWLDWIREIKD